MKKKIIGIYPWAENINSSSNGDKHQALFFDSLIKHGYSVKKINYKKGFPITYALKNNVDVLFLDWVHSFYTSQNLLSTIVKSFLGTIELFLLKKGKTKIIWNLHNLKRHDGRFSKIEKFCFGLLAKRVDFVRVFDNSHASIVSSYLNLKENKIICVPQGEYIYKENKIVNINKRYGIGTDKKILLFFGSIRYGKGLIEFIDVYEKTNVNNWVLLIAGKVNNKDLEKILLDKIKKSKNLIIFDNRYISDAEVKSYFDNVDKLLLPYFNTLNSGILLIAKKYGTPLLANNNFLKFKEKNDHIFDLLNPQKLSLFFNKNNLGSTKNKPKITDWNFTIKELEKVM